MTAATRPFSSSTTSTKRNRARWTHYSTVPTAAERSGNFCGLGITLYDPFSNLAGPRTPLGNGCQIPTINPAAAGAAGFLFHCRMCRGTVQNYLLQATVPLNTDTLNVHVLHTINAKFNLNGGYNLNSQRQNTLGTFPDIAGAHPRGTRPSRWA